MPKPRVGSDQHTGKRAAVMLPLCVVDGEPSVLLTLRSKLQTQNLVKGREHSLHPAISYKDKIQTTRSSTRYISTIIIHTHTHTPEFSPTNLLSHRSQNVGTHKGQVSFPGGHLDLEVIQRVICKSTIPNSNTQTFSSVP